MVTDHLFYLNSTCAKTKPVHAVDSEYLTKRKYLTAVQKYLTAVRKYLTAVRILQSSQEWSEFLFSHIAT